MIINAKIIKTRLGSSSAPVFDSEITLEDGNKNPIRFGGWTLDNKPIPESLGHRTYSLALSCWVSRILEIAGAKSWEDLAGCYVRVDIEDGSVKASRIGHLMRDEWFEPPEHLPRAIEFRTLVTLPKTPPEDPFAS
jgi:hypothetical protein